VWRELEAAVDAGSVRSLGCSNMTAKKLHALLHGDAASGTPPCRIRPVVVQVELHPFLAQPGLKAFCDAEGVALTGYHPLGSPSRPAQ
jgi:alcohol dehydrogenase (NADP+)